MPLPTSSLIAWIQSLGWDASQETGAPLFKGPYIQPMPDKCVTITVTPGPGYQMEGAADASAFQARVRGPQNDQDAAEALALRFDALIFGASFPVVVGGQTIVHCHRLGGPPSPLSATPDVAERSEFVSSYVLTAST